MSICAFSALQPESIGFTGKNRSVYKLIKISTDSYSTGFLTIPFTWDPVKTWMKKNLLHPTKTQERKEWTKCQIGYWHYSIEIFKLTNGPLSVDVSSIHSFLSLVL